MSDQQLLFEERFLEKYAGQKILNDPVTAIIELIANSWDAGATEVHITWPDGTAGTFAIVDDGCGLTSSDFEKIWSTLYYDRVKHLGNFAIDIDGRLTKKRFAFGRNGIGRCAAFCFGDEYEVISRRNGKEIHYAVSSLDQRVPFKFRKLAEVDTIEKGTEIRIGRPSKRTIELEKVRSEIGMRFLSDPEFRIFLQDELVTFDDIDPKNVVEFDLPMGDLGTVKIKVIDTQDSDRTTKHHGIAWRVNNRLVGEVTWSGLSGSYNIDGRRIESRRYSFIVFADFLSQEVLPDWSGFVKGSELVARTEKEVYTFVWNKLIELSKEQRAETYQAVRSNLSKEISQMTPLRVEKWSEFIIETQEKCPSLSEKELQTIGGILANLEISSSRYSLLDQLNELSPDQLDDLDLILKTWSIDYAKIVLDELQNRLGLLKRLQETLLKLKADEVQELQPLFERGLWIFGPEYETIEYTSNRGMTKVIQDMYGEKIQGSRNRPDFVVFRNSTLSLYSYPTYDEEGAEVGIDRLVIVELKAPGVPITSDEINQPYKYIKELFEKGMLQKNISRVMCFVIGDSIEDAEDGITTKMNDTVVIKPLVYDIVIRRAKSRLFNLFDKLKDAPFITDIDASFYGDIEKTRSELLV